MIPSLSQVKNWDTAHLTEAATHWTKTAYVWNDVFTNYAQQVNNPGGMPWEGEAAEAAQQLAHTDRMTVIGLADQLHDASKIARTGAMQLAEHQRLVLRTVEAAQNDGFTVGEDFSVSDHNVYNRAAAALRQAKAEGFAADLRAAVADLMAADQRIAAEITSATTGLGTDPFNESGGAPNAQGGDKDKSAIDHLSKNMTDGEAEANKPGSGTDKGAIEDAKPENNIRAVDFRKRPAPLSPADSGDSDDGASGHTKYGGRRESSFGKDVKPPGREDGPIRPDGKVVKQSGTPIEPDSLAKPIKGEAVGRLGKLDGKLSGPTVQAPQGYTREYTDGLVGKAGLGGYLAQGEASYSTPGRAFTADGRAGLFGYNVDADVVSTDHGSYAGFEANLYAAKAGGEATWNLGPLHLSLGAEGQAGVGAGLHAGYGVQDGRWVFGSDAELAWGLGGKIAPRVELDYRPVIEGLSRALSWLDGVVE